MRLNEIFEHSKGRLSHAELNLYLAFCSFADNDTGECFPKQKTVARRAEVGESYASKIVLKLIELGFLQKTEDGFLCLIGYKKTSNECNFSSTEDKENSEPKAKKLAMVATETSNGCYSHIKEGTTQLTKEKTNKKSETSSDVSVVFDHWKKTLNHPKATLDKKRIERINARLKTFSAADLINAINGVQYSPHHIGENAQKMRYDGIQTIFRDTEQVEKFIALYERHNATAKAAEQETDKHAELLRLMAEDQYHQMRIWKEKQDARRQLGTIG
jgi:hypothetical protein